MQIRQVGILIVIVGPLLAGCQQAPQAPQAPQADLTFQRGVQLLAAGSPRSAIPFFTQVIASAPDGPAPHALLSLAYALDLQRERAILQAAQAHRAQGEPPGWELVAIGIARMTQGQYEEAVQSLDRLVSASSQSSPMAISARQWLTLAILLKGDSPGALESLEPLIRSGSTRTTGLLWAVLIESHTGRSPQAGERLAEAARTIAVPDRYPQDMGGEVDDQATYDAAVASLAKGELPRAYQLFAALQQRSPKFSDAPVWLSLIAAAQGDWPLARSRLREACRKGSCRSQGLAKHLYSVVCAIDGKPDAAVQLVVVGQRLLGRSNLPLHVVKQPQSDVVWFSDVIK